MKIGVRAHDFGKQNLDSLAAKIKNAGFDCIQLALTKAIVGVNYFNDITEKLLEEVYQAFDKHELEITVLGCYIEPSVSDKSERFRNVDIFKQGLNHAKKLGVGIVGTETTHLDINATASEREKVYSLLRDSVLRMVEEAEKVGVYVGIEPVAEHTLNTPELTRRLLDEVNSTQLKVIFDPVNLVLPGTIHNQSQIFNEMFDHLGNEIEVMHIKDIVIEGGEKTWRNIGDGVIDYALIINRLKTLKPQIRLLREGAKVDSYTRDIDRLKNLLKNS